MHIETTAEKNYPDFVIFLSKTLDKFCEMV